MHELFRDPFAHHVYEAIMMTLSGRAQNNIAQRSDSKKRKRHDSSGKSLAVPERFPEILAKLLGSVKQFEWSVLETMAFDRYAVPVIQAIIDVDVPKMGKKKSKGESKYKSLIEILLSGAGDLASTLISTYLTSSPRGVHQSTSP
jgi:NOP9-like PUF repeat domain